MRKLLLSTILASTLLGTVSYADEFKVTAMDLTGELGEVLVQRGNQAFTVTEGAILYSDDIVTTSSFASVRLIYGDCTVELKSEIFFEIKEDSFCDQDVVAPILAETTPAAPAEAIAPIIVADAAPSVVPKAAEPIVVAEATPVVEDVDAAPMVAETDVAPAIVVADLPQESAAPIFQPTRATRYETVRNIEPAEEADPPVLAAISAGAGSQGALIGTSTVIAFGITGAVVSNNSGSAPAALTTAASTS